LSPDPIVTSAPQRGELVLVPAPLGDLPLADCLPAPALERVRSLAHFIAESARTARAVLKPLADRPVSTLDIRELPRQPDAAAIGRLLAPIEAGHSVGLLSEAGLPSIADPGQVIVLAAHERAIRVVPLVGPSSILLAIAASGLLPQRFAFHAYLPVKDAPLRVALRQLERDAAARGEVQAWIEAPYRNDRMVGVVLETCRPDTRFAIAADLTLPGEWIASATIGTWRARPRPALDRRPAVFMLAAG